MSRYKRRYGDRKDGRLIRSLPAFNKFIPYIMPTRNDAHNYYEESFLVGNVDKRLRQLRVAGYKGIGLLHFLIAAYVRCVSMLPGINRFVAGRRVYAKDTIEVVMAVKRSLSIDATETTIKVQFEPTEEQYTKQLERKGIRKGFNEIGEAIEETDEDTVALFDHVTIWYEDDEEERTITIVTTLRNDVLNGLISKESPLGKALLGRRVGERVKIDVNETYSYYVEIRDLEKGADDASLNIN